MHFYFWVNYWCAIQVHFQVSDAMVINVVYYFYINYYICVLYIKTLRGGVHLMKYKKMHKALRPLRHTHTHMLRSFLVWPIPWTALPLSRNAIFHNPLAILVMHVGL